MPYLYLHDGPVMFPCHCNKASNTQGRCAEWDRACNKEPGIQPEPVHKDHDISNGHQDNDPSKCLLHSWGICGILNKCVVLKKEVAESKIVLRISWGSHGKEISWMSFDLVKVCFPFADINIMTKSNLGEEWLQFWPPGKGLSLMAWNSGRNLYQKPWRKPCFASFLIHPRPPA